MLRVRCTGRRAAETVTCTRKSNFPKPAKNTPNAKDDWHTYHPSGLLLVNPHAPHPRPHLHAAWAHKLAHARTTLRQAAAEYTRRHSRLPPRGFDIERDLGPFYGVRGGESRAVQHGREAHMDLCTLGKDMGDGRDVYGEAYADEESESLGTDTVLGGHSGSYREAGCATGDRLCMLNFWGAFAAAGAGTGAGTAYTSTFPSSLTPMPSSAVCTPSREVLPHGLEQRARRYQATEERVSDFEWCCPGCQARRVPVPTAYCCFCDAVPSPVPSRISSLHSCASPCARARPACAHPCPLLCHPGPCPPCRITTDVKCGCPKGAVLALRCGETELSCGAVCGRTLACGAHTCTRPCHADACDPCVVRETTRCWCGKHEKEVSCGEGEAVPCSSFSPSSPEAEELWIGRFACADSCDRLFACGVHRCAQPCHAGRLLATRGVYARAGIDDPLARTARQCPVPNSPAPTRRLNARLNTCGVDARAGLDVPLARAARRRPCPTHRLNVHLNACGADSPPLASMPVLGSTSPSPVLLVDVAPDSPAPTRRLDVHPWH
ncbi:hypothetical protein B0H14DRAFT_3785499 [Mycena olivaceomarginata]|nr:hypothetical protein B0H14DRAFT_3785499 [Mycena olivaceomarginata]